MGFDLTPEQEALRKEIRRLAEDKVAPRAAEIDRTDEYPWDIQKLLAEQGLLGYAIPEEYGGSGADLLSCCIVGEELARISAISSLIFVVQKLAVYPIIIAGSEEIKRKYLPPTATGEKLSAFCLTERESGSDAGATRTTARLEGDNYIINGQKCFITNGGLASVHSLFAMTDPEKKYKGISAFVVEKEFPGYSLGKIEDKMGMNGAQVAELIFEDMPVPVANRLGGEGTGFITAMKTLDNSRPLVGAQALGIAQGALEYATSWAREREAFGKPIGTLQGVGFMLADMATEVEASRLLIYKAAAMADAKDPNLSIFSAMSKMKASDVAMNVTTDAVQIMGGYGFMKDHPVERMMRDAKITQIYEGTNQVQRVVISRALMRG